MKVTIRRILKRTAEIDQRGAEERRVSRRREIEGWATWVLALTGALSPWAIYWITGGK
jgi:hypothetical protein